MASADILDYEADDIDMEEDGEVNFILDNSVLDGIVRMKEAAKRRKGRGFASEGTTKTEIKHYEGVEADDEDDVAQKSVEGWILFVSGVHEEASDDELRDKFSEFGQIKNFHLNLDRRTGFIKGYALVEYEKRSEAEAARVNLDNTDMLGQIIRVNWCFVQPPKK
ncbi:unnamed protein product [Notodromas monacha]|uniref:RNA-binding protein 8A n=1 Tax=Notodromas monacha TaxID=399045 RepID=A0A7R9BJ22_9CRUS|nr:unnamed protein product [Notodromas monacha]CAG0915318.1 unnamed protein product [Notodromas monacha]